jgi:hypothetical protein
MSAAGAQAEVGGGAIAHGDTCMHSAAEPPPLVFVFVFDSSPACTALCRAVLLCRAPC